MTSDLTSVGAGCIGRNLPLFTRAKLLLRIRGSLLCKFGGGGAAAVFGMFCMEEELLMGWNGKLCTELAFWRGWGGKF